MKNEEFKVKSEQRTVGSGQFTVNSGQRPFHLSPSILPMGGTNVRVGPISRTSLHPLTSVATNGGKRLFPRRTGQVSPLTGAMSFSAFQKVQNVPEVKQAREEAAEAQRRYFEAMKRVAEGKK